MAIYLGSIAYIGILAAASNAVAQTAAPVAQPSSAEADQVGDIVVKAQRRDQQLLDVPIAVDVLPAKILAEAGITGAKEYTMLTPNVFFDENDNQSQMNGDISIRGVSDLTSGGNERGIQSRSAIGTYVDDFSVGDVASGSANPPLIDIDHVEILKGPQSLYFGRAAEGGAVNIVSKQPVDQNSILMEAGTGSFSDFNAGAVVNQVLQPDLFIRGSVYWDQNAGYVKNLSPTGTSATDRNLNGKVDLRWAPGKWTIDLVGQVTHDQEGNLGYIPTGVNPIGLVEVAAGGEFSALATCGLGQGILITQSGGNTKYNCNDTPGYTHTTNLITTIKAQYVGDKFIFTSLTGRLGSDYNQLYDQDQTGAGVFTRTNIYQTESWSQEFRLTSKGDSYKLFSTPYDWTLGLYAYNDNGHYDNTITTGPGAVPALTAVTVPGDEPNTNHELTRWDGIAGFADSTFHLTKTVELSIGARYSYDHNEQAWSQTYSSFNCSARLVVNGVIPPLQNGCFVPANELPLTYYPGTGGTLYVTGGTNQQTLWSSGTQNSNNFDPRVALNWRPVEGQSFYATYGMGYNPGGIRDNTGGESLAETTGQVPTPDGRSFYKSEVVTNYELGWKGFFDEKKILIQADVFRIDWSNMQFRVNEREYLQPNGSYSNCLGQPASCSTSTFVTQDFVQNAKAALSQGAELSGTYKLNEHFLVQAAGGYLDAKYTNFKNAPTSIAPTGNLDGQPLPDAPKWSGSVLATVNWTFGEVPWHLTASVTYKDPTYTEFADVLTKQWPQWTPSITLVNLNSGIVYKGNMINLSVENLFDKQYELGYQYFSGQGDTVLTHPRLIKLTWSRKFGG